MDIIVISHAEQRIYTTFKLRVKKQQIRLENELIQSGNIAACHYIRFEFPKTKGLNIPTTSAFVTRFGDLILVDVFGDYDVIVF